MAIQTAVIASTPFGEKRRTRTFVAFGPGYPLDGEPVTARQLGLYRVFDFVASRVWPTTAHDYTVSPSPVETPLFYLRVFQGDYDNPTDGPLVEVANGSDLTGLYASITAVGI